MSNELAVMGFDPKAMAVALKQAAKTAAPMTAFLGMDKGGVWTFGMDGNEVGDDDEFLVHPGGFVHGWVAWADTELPGVSAAKLGEVMTGVAKPMPEEPEETPPKCRAWQTQMGLSLVAAEGGDQMTYSTTSVGGKRAVANVAGLVADKLMAGEVKCVPVVTLGCESYKHAKYGKINNPIFTVVRWVAMPQAGQTAKEVAKPAAKKIAAKPAAKRTK
jgi:hypothetical protein